MLRSSQVDSEKHGIGGASPYWDKLFDIENKAFTERRLRLYGWGVVVAFVIVLAWEAFKHQWPVLSNGNPTCIDFGWIWKSGELAASGDLARVFDYSAFSAAQLAFFGPEDCINYNRFYYPPTFLFFTYALGLMPYLIAFAVWIVATFALYEAAVYAILPRRAALIAAAAPAFVPVNLLLGHTGFLTAAFIGLSLAFMEKRPWLSGGFLSLLTYKPHFGVLFPIAIVASRNWRALAAVVAATAILSVMAAISFGYQGWASFVDALTDRSSSLGPAPDIEMRLQSVFGVFHWAGTSSWISWVAQSAVSIVVALGIGMLWAKPFPYNLKAAALCAGLLLVTPYAVLYDLCILTIGAAFFVKHALMSGFVPGERTAMLICWLALFLIKLPIGPIVSAALLVLCVRRMFIRTELTAG